MASSKKPAINLGPVDDWAAKAIKKALMGLKGPAKKQQAAKIVSQMKKKAGGEFSKSTQSQRIYQLERSATKAKGQFARSATKRREMTAIKESAAKHSTRMTKAGKNWDGSKNPRLAKSAKVNAKSQAENKELAKAYEKKMAGPPAKVKKQIKQINKIDIEAARGTGSVHKKGGKKIPVSPKRAAAARSRSGAMSSQLKKSNAAELNELARLQAAVRNAGTADQRLAARRQLRDFRNTTGR